MGILLFGGDPGQFGMESKTGLLTFPRDQDWTADCSHHAVRRPRLAILNVLQTLLTRGCLHYGMVNLQMMIYTSW